MNTIQFAIANSSFGDHLTTNIYIDGFDLRMILASLEVNQSTCDISKNIVGVYEGVSPFIAFHLHQHFLKDTIREYSYFEDRLTLLEYGHSGIPGDHTVACYIHIYDKVVEWTNFKNYSSILKDGFDYSDLSFKFDRKQYETAIEHFTKTEISEIYL